jgi:hypothetical protein
MSGQASTLGQGSVAHGGFSIALTGQLISSGQGLLDLQRGIAAFVSAGSLAPRLTPTGITGQLISVGQGFVTVLTSGGTDVTVHIGGSQQINSAVGTVRAGTTPTSQVSTSAAGTAGVLLELPITGLELTSSAGTIVQSQDDDDTSIISAAGIAGVEATQALTGSAFTAEQGDIATSDKEEPLTQQFAMVPQAGDVGIDLFLPLSGELIEASQENVSAPGFAELVGAEVLVEQGFLGREIAITGSEATFSQGSVEGLPGIVALVGEEFSVQQGSLATDRPTTQWTTEDDPTTPWTPTAGPTSSWTRRSGPSTPWTRKT